jgi:methionyl-tRNA formyltransferase
MRVVFLGTPEFATPSLNALIGAGRNVVAVFTQPDRPKGRGNQLAQSPVKLAAMEHGLPVYQPERIRGSENIDLLKSLAADLMVVVGYGQIIPQAIIDLPPHGILNVHASLLPKYRGAAPIQWAIANGEKETGVTIMQIDAGLDTGDMLLKSSTGIHPDETSPQLSARLAQLGAGLLMEAIGQIASGTIAREKQDNAQATLAPILKKEDGLIVWSRPARQIYNRLRGFQPWPGAYSAFRGQQLGIAWAAIGDGKALEPGTMRHDKRRLFVGCAGNTTLELLEVQPAGKKRMSGEAFLNGYKIPQNERLGDLS